MRQPNQSNLKKYLQFTSIPFEMGIIIYAGYLLGTKLDNNYPNENNIYMLTATLSAVFIAMFYIIWRVRKLTK
jgi:membrane protein DedA with SNARE-associated domain